jgi:Fe-S cluster assembly iron-binding protein IscA
MDLAKGPEKGDATIEQEGVKVFLAKEADVFLSHATFDYSEIQGFIISGMQQSSCCG